MRCFREPLSGRAERTDDLGIAIDHPVLAFDAAVEVRVESHACDVSRLCNAARCAGLELRSSADLPAAQQLAAQSRCIAEKRQTVDVVDHENMACIEFGGSPHCTRVVSVRDDIALVRAVIHTL